MLFSFLELHKIKLRVTFFLKCFLFYVCCLNENQTLDKENLGIPRHPEHNLNKLTLLKCLTLLKW